MLSLETKLEMLQLGNLNIKGKCFIVLIKKKTRHVVVSNSKFSHDKGVSGKCNSCLGIKKPKSYQKKKDTSETSKISLQILSRKI